jgi:hypothetical protein
MPPSAKLPCATEKPEPKAWEILLAYFGGDEIEAAFAATIASEAYAKAYFSAPKSIREAMAERVAIIEEGCKISRADAEATALLTL